MFLCQKRCHTLEHPLNYSTPAAHQDLQGWSPAASKGHSKEPSRRWRLAKLSLYCRKDISVNPGVLYRSGKKQDDHQELPNSSLRNATCPSPAHPENNVQGTQNLSLCQKGRTHHCLKTWNFYILHLELKTTLSGPIFCCFFCKKNAHLQSLSIAWTERTIATFLGERKFRSQKFQTTY